MPSAVYAMSEEKVRFTPAARASDRATDAVAFGRLADMQTSGSAPYNEEVHRKFLTLAVLWKYDQGPSSSVMDMVIHPAYLQIIGLGRAVLPFLFGQLEREPDHWFFALAAITGEDPVPPESSGNLKAMTNAWLSWGRGHGYL